MARFIFFALIAALVWAWWSRRTTQRGMDDRPAADPVPPMPEPAVMVPCAHCGTHFPQKDGFSTSTGELIHWYCSSAHRDLGPRRPA
jgi:uncharacterized protein